MESAWTQIAVSAATVFTALFFTIRYMSLQSGKRERQLQAHNENMQKMQYEYYETKNGHMERMARDFTKSSNKMANALNKLTSEMKVLNSKKH